MIGGLTDGGVLGVDRWVSDGWTDRWVSDGWMDAWVSDGSTNRGVCYRQLTLATILGVGIVVVAGSLEREEWCEGRGGGGYVMRQERGQDEDRG